MAPPRPSFTIGIEEEYLLVDPESRDLIGFGGPHYDLAPVADWLAWRDSL